MLDYNNAVTPSFRICEEALRILHGDLVTPSHHPNLKHIRKGDTSLFCLLMLI